LVSSTLLSSMLVWSALLSSTRIAHGLAALFQGAAAALAQVAVSARITAQAEEEFHSCEGPARPGDMFSASYYVALHVLCRLATVECVYTKGSGMRSFRIRLILAL